MVDRRGSSATLFCGLSGRPLASPSSGATRTLRKEGVSLTEQPYVPDLIFRILHLPESLAMTTVEELGDKESQTSAITLLISLRTDFRFFVSSKNILRQC